MYLLKLFPNDCFYNCCFHLEIQTSLCDPGPELIVCDEGHRIKNDSTNISQALKRIKTKYVKLMLNTIEPLSNRTVWSVDTCTCDDIVEYVIL